MIKGMMYKFEIEDNNKIESVLGICVSVTDVISIVGITDRGLEYRKSLPDINIKYSEVKLGKYDEEIRELFNIIYTFHNYNRYSTLKYSYSTETNKKQQELLDEISIKLGFMPKNTFERYIIDKTRFDSVRVLNDQIELSKTDVLKRSNCDDINKDSYNIEIKDRRRLLGVVTDTVESGFNDGNLYYVQTIYYRLDGPLNMDTANTVCESFS